MWGWCFRRGLEKIVKLRESSCLLWNGGTWVLGYLLRVKREFATSISIFLSLFENFGIVWGWDGPGRRVWLYTDGVPLFLQSDFCFCLKNEPRSTILHYNWCTPTPTNDTLHPPKLFVHVNIYTCNYQIHCLGSTKASIFCFGCRDISSERNCSKLRTLS